VCGAVINTLINIEVWVRLATKPPRRSKPRSCEIEDKTTDGIHRPAARIGNYSDDYGA
jgi:hypothetical protein